MLTDKEQNVWNSRWAALEARLTYLSTVETSSFSRKYALLNLTTGLKTFAKRQFDYFLKGFSQNSRENDKLQMSPEYPPHYVLSVILDQIAFDLEVIERATYQRQPTNENPLNTVDGLNRLEQADKLAWRALKPATGLLGVAGQETTVITYFQKSLSIRVIPYATVALIGLPFTVQDVPQDYLAIPHEVGHYVYRNGKFGKTSIREVLQEEAKSLSEEVRKWVEEIFADVYGCWVGGPVMAIDFQDLQLKHSKKIFSNGDGVHPIPFLRPYVYAYTLERMGGFQSSSNKLKDRWNEKLADKRGMIIPDVEQYIAYTEMKKVIEKITSEFSASLDASVTPWSTDEEIENKDTTVKDIIADANTLSQKLDLNSFQVEERYGTTLVEETHPEEKDVQTWLKVLDADGWATRGPQTSGN